MPDRSGKFIYTHTCTHYLQVLKEEPSGLCALVKCPAGQKDPNGNQNPLKCLICHLNYEFDTSSLLACYMFFPCRCAMRRLCDRQIQSNGRE